MQPVLRLYEDVLSNGSEAALPALPRMIFVVHGSLTVADRTVTDGEAWSSEGAATLKAGNDGAAIWRWELTTGGAVGGAAKGNGVTSREKLSAELATMPKGALLLRGDSVAFPPGGCAYLHRHQGPGHPLSARRRYPHRYPRPLDLVRPRRRLVRDRTGWRVCAGRRPADPLCPGDDPAGVLRR